MSDGRGNTFQAGQVALVAAAVVILIAGMKASSDVLLPFLVSVFTALICGPPVFWLQRRGVPGGLAVTVVVLVLLGLGTAIGALVGTSINDFYRSMPAYEDRFRMQGQALLDWLASMGVTVPSTVLTDIIDPGAVMQLAAGLLSGVGGMVTNAFIILLTVIFMLLEASSLPVKIRAAIRDPQAEFPHFDEIIANVNRYVAMKTWMSLATGLLAGVWVAVLGVDFAVLWGVLAFLFNYVPNIGSVIAAVPAVLLAFIQYGVGSALLVLAGYVVLNNVIGNVIEPRVMGQGLGLSTLVVFLSLVFWEWVFGPIGMLLSVPLTMTLKIVLDGHDDTRWVAILLGSGTAAEAMLRQAKAEAPVDAEAVSPPDAA